MPSATLKRPGIAFETRTPALGEALPRLDIAAFVGFAASGPIGLPVPIEDAPRFHELFGTDVPLAWDDVRCDWEYGELAPSVRAFFRGGGQRCWIVRAANAAQAASNCFPIPGVLAAGPEEVPGAAAALARSPGSWSDTLLVNATLSLRPLAPPPAGASAVSGVRAGDMVRLQYDDPGITGFVAATLPPGGSTVQPVDAGTWFQRVTPDTLPPPGAPMGDVAWLEPPVRVRALTGAAAAGPGALVDPLIDIAGWGWRGEQLLVELTSDGPSILRPGSWLQLSLTGAGAPRRPEVYLLVEQVEHEETLSPPGGVLARLVSQSAWWLLDAAAVVPSLPTPAPQRATLEL